MTQLPAYMRTSPSLAIMAGWHTATYPVWSCCNLTLKVLANDTALGGIGNHVRHLFAFFDALA